MLCALALAGCSSVEKVWSGREQLDKPPNARGLVIEYRATLWRDLASIRRASITEPQRDEERNLWRVCVRLDIKGSLGKYTGERDYVVAIYGVAKRPELLMEDAGFCAALPHELYPELEGGYTVPDPKGKAEGARR
jgi:hypothetical protein